MGQRWEIEGVKRMKKLVKDTIGHFRVLVEHSLREYEPSPGHILKRMIKPLCRDISSLRPMAPRTMHGRWLRVLVKYVNVLKGKRYKIE